MKECWHQLQLNVYFMRRATQVPATGFQGINTQSKRELKIAQLHKQ